MGTAGALCFTAPPRTRITTIADTPSCTIALHGLSAACVNDIWKGTKNVTLAIDQDAPSDSVGHGTMVFDTGSAGVSSTPGSIASTPAVPGTSEPARTPTTKTADTERAVTAAETLAYTGTQRGALIGGVIAAAAMSRSDWSF